jgi:hypothetical protein
VHCTGKKPDEKILSIIKNLRKNTITMKTDKIERFLEFIVVGILFGTVEDLVAVKLATGAEFNPEMILIVVGVTIPFAAFSELYVDHPEIRPMKTLARKTRDKLN